MAKIPTMTVEVGGQMTRINVADFDAAKHKIPGTAEKTDALPDNWRDYPAADVKQWAEKLTGEPMPNRAAAVAAIEGVLDSDESE